MVKKETINATEIAVLAGVKATNAWAGNKLHRDSTFPRPIIEQTGGGHGQAYWFKYEVVAWLAKAPEKPKGPVVRQAAKLYAARRNTLDLGLTLQFICAKKITSSHLHRSRHARLVLSQFNSNGEQPC